MVTADAAATKQSGSEIAQSDAEAIINSKLCYVCQTSPVNYRCPGCQLQTCSLSCSKQHKQQTGCSGQRDKFAFVPMQQFTDRQFLRDYRWLEEVSRADNNARRLRPPIPRKELPHHLSQLVHQARYRGIKLLIMPPGMQKRQHNSTRYDFRNRKMFWRVEWRFPAAATPPATSVAADKHEQQQAPVTPAAAAVTSSEQQQHHSTAATAANPGVDIATAKPYVITDGRVDEESVVITVLQRHLEYQPGAGGQALLLRAYREAALENLTVIMRKERCPANAVCYHRIDLQQSLRSQLAGKLIIEYPSFIVLLPGQESAYHILTPEEEQQQQQLLFARPGGAARQQQQQHQFPPPPPPPPPKPAVIARLEGEQQKQQQQQQQGIADHLHPDQPAAKRPCLENAGTAVGHAADLANSSSAVEASHQQQQERTLKQHQQQQQAEAEQQEDHRDLSMPKYYYYDPTAGADEDAADFLAGLDDDDDDDGAVHDRPKQQQQQQQQQVRQQESHVLGGEEGRAAMMALLGQYDENEIDID